jgi:hypothetical protein
MPPASIAAKARALRFAKGVVLNGCFGTPIGSVAGRKVLPYHHSHPTTEWTSGCPDRSSGETMARDNGGLTLRMSILPGVMAPSIR